MKKASILILIILLLIFLPSTGCLRARKPPVEPEAESSRQAEKKPLRISIAGFVARKETFNSYIELSQYISKKLDRPVELLQRKTYKEVNALLKKGKVDIAFVCSPPYIQARRNFEVELLVVPVFQGEPVYHSYIVVRKDSGITNFADLKGKTFGFSDPLSNSGKLYPTYLLATQGTTPEAYFSQYIFTYNHEKSVDAVIDRVVDGAAVSGLVVDYLLLSYPERMKNLKIILKSPPFPIPPIVVRKDLDPTLKVQLKKIFLNMHKDKKGEKILKSIMFDRFIEADDQMYDPIRQMMRVVGER